MSPLIYIKKIYSTIDRPCDYKSYLVMAAKKKSKKASVKVSPKSSGRSRSSSTSHHPHNNFLFLVVATAAIIVSYFVFTNNMRTNKSDSSLKKVAGTPVPVYQVNIPLNEQNNSGQIGDASITADGDKVIVKITLKNTPKSSVEPAHIHVGSCIDAGEVAYPLSNVVNGVSETVVDTTIEKLIASPYMINVHKSPTRLNEYVSCGNIES